MLKNMGLNQVTMYVTDDELVKLLELKGKGDSWRTAFLPRLGVDLDSSHRKPGRPPK